MLATVFHLPKNGSCLMTILICQSDFVMCRPFLPFLSYACKNIPHKLGRWMDFIHQIHSFMNHFFEAILNEAFRSPNHKTFFSFILGCPQDFNFAWPFHPFSPVSTQPYQNGWAKLKSYKHPRIKLKKCFVVGRPKSFIENCRRKIDS